MKDTDKVTLTIAQLKTLILEAKKVKQIKEDDEQESLGKYRMFLNNVQICNRDSKKEILDAAKEVIDTDKFAIPGTPAKGEVSYRITFRWKDNDLYVKRLVNGETF